MEPLWLTSTTEHWKKPSSFEPIIAIPEKRIVCHIQVNNEFVNNCLCRYPYIKTVRIVAYILRFIFNVGKIPNVNFIPLSGPITPLEFNKALRTCVKLIQSFVFQQEIQALLDGRKLTSKSALHYFNPFLDESNILRIGGRLQNANIPEEEKHQMLLPSKHPFVKQLIIHTHQLLCHAGPQLIIIYEKHSGFSRLASPLDLQY